MEQLYQDNPYPKYTYIPRDKHGNPGKNRSYTDSLESYQNGAHKELLILCRNGRLPTVDVVIGFLKEKTPAEIMEYRTKISRYLNRHKVEAAVGLELTKGEDGLANNCVHLHNIIDDTRHKNVITGLFDKACLSSGLKSGEYKITYRQLWDGYKYLEYFVKYGKHGKDNILFQSGTGLQRFYTIGKWFTKSKKVLWEEIIEVMREKYGTDPDSLDCENNLVDDVVSGIDNESPNEPDCNDDSGYEEICAQIEYEIEQEREMEQAYDDYRYYTTIEDLKRSEVFIPVKYQRSGWERPTDHNRLKRVIQQESDQVLYDWYSILRGKPTIFRTKPPHWLVDTIQRQHRKRHDLLDALYERLRHTQSFDIVVAFEIYHDHYL